MVRKLLSLGFCLLLCAACSDDDTGRRSEPQERTEGPLYAVMYEIYNGEESDSYLSVFDSLDLKEIDTSNAREFAGGRAFMQAYGDWVFVGEPGTPTVHRFTIDSRGRLVEKGSVSFANYGLTEAAIDDWTINFISKTKAYIFVWEEGTTILWNPSTMEIEGEIAAPEGYVRDGFEASTSTAVIRDGKLFRTVYWQNDDTFEMSEDQLLLVYDVEEDELASMSSDTRCPASGNRAFQGEDGTLYFSNWIWPVANTLLYDGPKNCVLRVLPDEETFDSEWRLDFSELADGREGAMFTYLADGKGLVSIFHDEDVERDEETDPWEFAGEPKWELWSVDLEARSGEPVPGVRYNSGAYTPVTIDGRTFLMIPDGNWETTQLYELSGDRARKRVQIPGWSYMFQKIRD